MNELNQFIVWDIMHEKWLDMKELGDDDSFTYNGLIRLIDDPYYSIHNYIGKTDIEGNKIYADCSIVEWEHQENKYTGYFKYQTEFLRYVLVSKDNNGESQNLDPFYLPLKNLKVIGTLQQEKDLL